MDSQLQHDTNSADAVTVIGNVAYREVPLSVLRVGMEVTRSIFGDASQKLIGPDLTITETMLRQLEKRGVDKVVVSEWDLDQLEARADDEVVVDRCPRCDLSLPLKHSEEDESSVTWVCAQCNSVCEGELDIELAATLMENLRIKKFEINRTDLVRPPETVAAAVRRLVGKDYDGPEQRASIRSSIHINVPVVPVDAQYNPVGDPFMVTTRDISGAGICLMHSRPVKPKFLVVELPAPGDAIPIQVVVEVLRCRAVDSLFEIAGKFVMRAAHESRE